MLPFFIYKLLNFGDSAENEELFTNGECEMFPMFT